MEKDGYVGYRKDRKKWEARYYALDPLTDTYKSRSKMFDTKEEADRFYASIMYQREDPLYIKHNGIPFCEFMRSNLKLKLDTNQITEVTYHRVSKTIEQIEKFPLGKKNIDEITTEELQEFMNFHKYMSNSSINKLYQQLGTTFRLGINRGYLIRNPMTNVLKPKSDKLDKEIRALTFDEQQAITQYLLKKPLSECRYKNVYLIQMFMGLRVGEALALTMSDIDLQHRKMYIRKTLTKDELGKTVMGKTTKTYAGQRTLPIPEFLMETIIEQMRKADKQPNNDEKLLFKPDDHKYANRENVNTELKRMLKRHFGIDDITTHSLRHTYGTRCIESGMAPVVVQKLMGHKDITVTINTYTSVYDEFKQKEVEKVNKYYLEQNMLEQSDIEQNMIEAVKMLEKEQENDR